MRTSLRKIGNSRGVLIPVALLAECGIEHEIEMRLDNGRIIIEPINPAREGWFDGYQAQADDDVWGELSPDVDAGEWAW